MAGDAMSIPIKDEKLGFRIRVVGALNYDSLINTTIVDFNNNNLNDRQYVRMMVTSSNGRGELKW
jgi:hypothetical protein